MNSTIYTHASQAWKFIEEKNADNTNTLSAKLGRKTLENAHDNTFVSFAQANFLKLQAKLIQARTVLIIGTDTGIEIPALVEGMNREGQLTVVTSSAEATNSVREIFNALQDNSTTKLRCVNTDAQTFLPRLNAHDYDMLVVVGEAQNYQAATADARRLLRDGGILVLTDAMALTDKDSHGGVADAADRSDKAVALREAIRAVDDDESFDVTLASIGTGLVLAVAQ